MGNQSTIYSKNDDYELLDMLAALENLTFQSQLDLQKELSQRNIPESAQALDQAIKKRKSEIKDLEFLKDIGFYAEKTADSIRIRRTPKAAAVDITSMVLGVVFCILGIIGVVSVVNNFIADVGFEISGLVGNLLMIGLGATGVKFLKGFKRFIDNWGLEVYKANGVITLKKRFDLKLEEVHKDPAKVSLQEGADFLILMLDQEELMVASTKSLTQQMTLKELAQLLKSSFK